MSVSIVIDLTASVAAYEVRTSSPHAPSVEASASLVSPAATNDDVLPKPRYVPPVATRSHVRPALPHVTCWNGKVVIEHPNVQDCPTRSVPKSAPAAPHHSTPHFAASGSASAWAHSYFAVRVANCESGGGANDHHTYYDGNPHVRGFYAGKWQMDADFWSSYGGHAYASTPADASEAEQDQVAYRGYQARGWQPWECAGMV